MLTCLQNVANDLRFCCSRRRMKRRLPIEKKKGRSTKWKRLKRNDSDGSESDEGDVYKICPNGLALCDISDDEHWREYDHPAPTSDDSTQSGCAALASDGLDVLRRKSNRSKSSNSPSIRTRLRSAVKFKNVSTSNAPTTSADRRRSRKPTIKIRSSSSTHSICPQSDEEDESDSSTDCPKPRSKRNNETHKNDGDDSKDSAACTTKLIHISYRRHKPRQNVSAKPAQECTTSNKQVGPRLVDVRASGTPSLDMRNDAFWNDCNGTGDDALGHDSGPVIPEITLKPIIQDSPLKLTHTEPDEGDEVEICVGQNIGSHNVNHFDDASLLGAQSLSPSTNTSKSFQGLSTKAVGQPTASSSDLLSLKTLSPDQVVHEEQKNIVEEADGDDHDGNHNRGGGCGMRRGSNARGPLFRYMASAGSKEKAGDDDDDDNGSGERRDDGRQGGSSGSTNSSSVSARVVPLVFLRFTVPDIEGQFERMKLRCDPFAGNAELFLNLILWAWSSHPSFGFMFTPLSALNVIGGFETGIDGNEKLHFHGGLYRRDKNQFNIRKWSFLKIHREKIISFWRSLTDIERADLTSSGSFVIGSKSESVSISNPYLCFKFDGKDIEAYKRKFTVWVMYCFKMQLGAITEWNDRVHFIGWKREEMQKMVTAYRTNPAYRNDIANLVTQKLEAMKRDVNARKKNERKKKQRNSRRVHQKSEDDEDSDDEKDSDSGNDDEEDEEQEDLYYFKDHLMSKKAIKKAKREARKKPKISAQLAFICTTDPDNAIRRIAADWRYMGYLVHGGRTNVEKCIADGRKLLRERNGRKLAADRANRPMLDPEHDWDLEMAKYKGGVLDYSQDMAWKCSSVVRWIHYQVELQGGLGKKNTLCIYAPENDVGKSTFMKLLGAHFKVHYLTRGDSIYIGAGYSSEVELFLMDSVVESHFGLPNGLSYPIFEGISGGDSVFMPIKYGHPITTDRQPLVMTSNYDITEFKFFKQRQDDKCAKKDQKGVKMVRSRVVFITLGEYGTVGVETLFPLIDHFIEKYKHTKPLWGNKKGIRTLEEVGIRSAPPKSCTGINWDYQRPHHGHF